MIGSFIKKKKKRPVIAIEVSYPYTGEKYIYIYISFNAYTNSYKKNSPSSTIRLTL